MLPPKSASRSKPNVVIVLADDMGWGDLGCYGAARIPTPAIDALAAEGLRATDCHAASALCTPSRYALLTGRYAWRSPLKQGVLRGHAPSILETERPTVASTLRAAGYATGVFGKWHLGLGWRFRDGRVWSAFEPGGPLRPELEDGRNVDHAAGFTDGPLEHGFDRFFGITGSLDMPPYCFLDQDHTVGVPSLAKQTLYTDQSPGLQVPDWDEQEVDARFTAEACGWMREQVDEGRPFFCYLPLSAPHRPCLPPDAARGRSCAGVRGDMVCVVDDAVGQISRTLAELGVDDHTLVIVTSDNGARVTGDSDGPPGHRANGDWRGQKADIWEGGHREPFVARWPGRIPAGHTVEALYGLVDLLPTIAAAAGIPVAPGAAEDGIDVLDTWTGERSDAGRRSLVQHSGRGMFSLRRDRWKLIMGSGSGGHLTEPHGRCAGASFPEGQLYDLLSDPGERENLWSSEPKIVSTLYTELKEIAVGPASGLSFDVPVLTHAR